MNHILRFARPEIAVPRSSNLSITSYLDRDSPCPHRVRVLADVMLFRAMIAPNKNVNGSRVRHARLLWDWAAHLDDELGRCQKWAPYYATWKPIIEGVERHALEGYTVLVTDTPINVDGAPRRREFVVYHHEVLTDIERNGGDPFESTKSEMIATWVEHALGHWEAGLVMRSPNCQEAGIVSLFYDWLAEFMPDPDDADDLRTKEHGWRFPMPSGLLSNDAFRFWQQRAPELTKYYVWMDGLELHVSIPALDLLRHAVHWITLHEARPLAGRPLS